ncbi:hypothetical protein BU15DRAFT_49486 [Melanogaster broomeanus]|nr:hypothetical protein BU15DRAFT_49486 [Melanogaster broomeanus]
MTTQTTNPVLTASYALYPPKGSSSPQSLASTVSHSFPIAISSENTSDAREYYSALRQSIAAAREKLGEELTSWRDVVGTSELGKEKSVKAAQVENEGEDEDEDEEV